MSSRIKLPFKLGDSSKKINEIEITETLKKDDFSFSEMVRYGFPYRPTTVTYDSVQKLLAIGTKHGIIKIYGGAFVECSLQHPSEVEIVQLVFRVNEGALISACRDNYIHLWNLRQKKPAIANSLRFIKEKISRCLLPIAFNSKWLLVGTYCGNVYVVNLDKFTLSSYKIMWNNAIGMGKSSHPGVIVDLSQNPDDPTRLYIGFSTHLSTPNSVPIGHVVCWNLQQKTSETVYTLPQGLTSVSWHYEGRQFMCSHCDGSLSVWNLRSADKPVSVNYPHTRICKDETTLKFGAITKVVWSVVKSSGDSFIIFSGGMPSQTDQQQITGNAQSSKPSSYFLTILRGQTTNVLHMDSPIVDFHVISPSPHIADVPDPSAVAILLENDLVMIDLKSENYPLFESLHTLDLHESAITYCDYITEPNPNFYQNLLRLQSKQTLKRTFSQQENPISGGRSGSTIFGYNELIITGHADGSIKFWDASGCNLVFLYKLRTNRLFDRIQSTNPMSTVTTNLNKEINSNIKFDTKSTRTNSGTNDEQQMLLNDDNPFSIYSIKMCCDGKYLIVAARGGHVTLFKFMGSELDKADEGLGDLSCLEIPIYHRNLTNDHDDLNKSATNSMINDLQSVAIKQNMDKKDFKSLLRAKMGYRRMAGYQPELVCLLSWLPNDKVPILTDIAINSKYGLLIFGLENGLVVVDYLSKFILMNMVTSDLYGTMDPFQRATSSPKRRTGTTNDPNNEDSNIFSYDYPHQSLTPISKAFSNIFSFNNIEENFSKNQVQSFDPFTQMYHTQTSESMSTIVPTSLRDYNDEKSPTSHNPTLAKTFRTIRKHLLRTSNNKNDNQIIFDQNDMSNFDEEFNSNFSKPTITTLNIKHVLPNDSSMTSFDNQIKTISSNIQSQDPYGFESTKDRSPKQKLYQNDDIYHQSMASRQAVSTTYTTYHSRTVTQSSPPCNTTVVNEKRSQVPSTDINSALYKPLTVDLPRSSSTSSLDNIVTNESICTIQFSESFTYKNDFTISPSVWLGTSAGSVIVVNLNINYEPRNISVVPSGGVFRLSGRLLHISFLDQKGAIIQAPSEKWDTKKTKGNRSTDGTQDMNASSVLPSSGLSSSPVTSTPSSGVQYAVYCSSKEARVFSLPSQISISKQKIFDSLGASASNIIRASVVKIAGSACLTCYLAAGRIHIYSLPSLRELFNANLDPVMDSFRSMIGLTFTFTNRGHGLYMCSPTEIQKITLSADVKEQINEMLCELYSPSITMPEAPKQNFFAKLFASNAMVDADQLFGETAGKAPAGVIKKEDVSVNMNQLRGTAESTNSAIHDTRMKLIERGQRLNEVEIASKQMTDRAEEFSSLTHKVMLKQKEKAEWSWPFTSKK
ncbi:unnamed protein product [Rotaria magnacalcarata]|uniref:V-SNARE coiled-coil homology domain-containing protein n=5 Tax=Rotaria magnacalcarata TaxID=392030 RepID=A0A816LWE6_9BILA|nr:unnamed protein product [Rotaria magnacalcarata]CAF2164630.1 unnamed protein product [Rotaria magnacalcarata]